MRTMSASDISPQQPLLVAIQSPTHIYGRSDANYVAGMIGLGCAALGLVLTWSSGTTEAAYLSIFFVSIISGMLVVRASSFDMYFTVGIDAATLALLLPVTGPVPLLPLWILGTFVGHWLSLGNPLRAFRTSIDIAVAGGVFVMVLALAFSGMTGTQVSTTSQDGSVYSSGVWVAAAYLALLAYGIVRIGISSLRQRFSRQVGLKEALRGIGWSRSILLFLLTFAEATVGGMLGVRLVSTFPGSDAIVGQQAIIVLVALCSFGVAGLVRTESAWHRANALAHALAEPFEESTQPAIEAHITRSIGQAMTSFTIEIQHVAEELEVSGEQASEPHTIERGNSLISPVLTAWFGQFQIVVKRTSSARPFNRSDSATLDAFAAIAQEKLLTVEQVNQLSDQANRDPMTGLLNYRGLRRALLPRESEQPEGIALIFLDLDNFKHVNDAYGHFAGNAVLREVGRRIESSIRVPDTAARIGGDEFVVALHGVTRREQAEAVAARLTEALATPVINEGVEIPVSASIGVALSGGKVDSSDALLKLADQHMYAAKVLHGADAVHTEEKRSQPLGFVNASAIKEGIESGDLHVFYQPVVDSQTGEIVAVEGLVRPGEGMPVCTAEELVFAARSFDLMDTLTEYVFTTATADFAMFQSLSPQLKDLHLNIDAAQLFAGPFLADYEHWRTVASSIVLEVNERWLDTWDGTVQEELREIIAEHQLRLAIDDFGQMRVGFLALLDLPIDVLKVDKSVIDAAAMPRTAALVSGMVPIAQQMGVELIFEGVETTDQLKFLRECGGRYIQGYLYSKPVPRDEFVALLRRNLNRA